MSNFLQFPSRRPFAERERRQSLSVSVFRAAAPQPHMNGHESVPSTGQFVPKITQIPEPNQQHEQAGRHARPRTNRAVAQGGAFSQAWRSGTEATGTMNHQILITKSHSLWQAQGIARPPARRSDVVKAEKKWRVHFPTAFIALYLQTDDPLVRFGQRLNQLINHHSQNLISDIIPASLITDL